MEQLYITDLININSLAEPRLEPQESPFKPMSELPWLTTSQPKGKPVAIDHVSIFSRLVSLVGQMRQELERHPERLLILNRGRRQQIISYLEYLLPQNAGFHPQEECLKKWIENAKPPGHAHALRIYFEDLALFFVSQVLIAKRWSDLGLLKLEAHHLKNLNWNLANHLKPYGTHDREGWQFTKPNIYSWYTPSSVLQEETWLTIESIDFSQHDFQTLQSLVRNHRQFFSDKADWKSYDSRWFESLWKELVHSGFKSEIELGSVFKRQAQVFCPTLRDGILMSTAPQTTWVGVEAQPLLLALAEFSLLWSGPKASPLWSQSNGLDCFQNEQLNTFQSLTTTINNKPLNLQKISEMEAFDLAIVTEEQPVRLGQKSREAVFLKNQIEQSSVEFLKKLRGLKTSLGTLQACLAASKLRPGAFLIWTREEPLSSIEGSPAIQWLLDRMILKTEISLGAIDHSLPTEMPLFPRFIYIFKREINLSTRSESRPEQISFTGNVRSHIELPILFSDVLQFALSDRIPSHGSWKASKRISPTPQKDWAQQWPNPAAQETLDAIEKLKSQSILLGSLVRIVNFSGPSIPLVTTSALDFNSDSNFKSNAHAGSILFQANLTDDKIHTHATIIDSEISKASLETVQMAVLLSTPSLSQRAWITEYLKRAPVKIWIEHFAERRGNKLIISDSLIKSIPIPKELAEDKYQETLNFENYQALFEEKEKCTNLINQIQNKLNGPDATRSYAFNVFYNLSIILQEYLRELTHFKNMISENSEILWSEIIKILPAAQWIPITYSNQVQISGLFPLHIPISRIVDQPPGKQGFLIFSEAGHNMNISIQDGLTHKIISQQINILKSNPCTWGEVLQFIRIPRQLELARQTANDILSSYNEKTALKSKIELLLTNCLKY